jgi:hypothetical protein
MLCGTRAGWVFHHPARPRSQAMWGPVTLSLWHRAGSPRPLRWLATAETRQGWRDECDCRAVRLPAVWRQALGACSRCSSPAMRARHRRAPMQPHCRHRHRGEAPLAAHPLTTTYRTTEPRMKQLRTDICRASATRPCAGHGQEWGACTEAARQRSQLLSARAALSTAPEQGGWACPTLLPGTPSPPLGLTPASSAALPAPCLPVVPAAHHVRVLGLIDHLGFCELDVQVLVH